MSKITYITSDGKEFDKLADAKSHEIDFQTIKNLEAFFDFILHPYRRGKEAIAKAVYEDFWELERIVNVTRKEAVKNIKRKEENNEGKNKS